MTTFSKAISNTYDAGVRTFVAPAVGGPFADRLFRVNVGIDTIAPPTAGEKGPTWNWYVLALAADGTKVWKFFREEVTS